MNHRTKLPNPWDIDATGGHGGNIEPLSQYVNSKTSRVNKRRAEDMAAPIVIQATVATDTTAKSWVKLPPISVESVVQITSSGVPIAHPIYALNVPPTDSSYTSGQGSYNASGTAYLLAVGQWWIYVPNQAGDGTTVSCTIYDASSELPAQATALQSNATSTTVDQFNLYQVGGVLSSAFDFVGRYKPVVWANEAVVSYSAADGSVLAANASRRALSVYNQSTTQTVALTIKNPATAVQGFITLLPQQGFVWNPLDAVTQQAIRSYGSGSGNLVVVEGT